MPPLVSVPTCGLKDHVTPMTVEPLTLATNVLDCPGPSDTDGEIVIDTGTRVTTVLAVLVVSAAAVAVTIMLCCVAMIWGAV